VTRGEIRSDESINRSSDGKNSQQFAAARAWQRDGHRIGQASAFRVSATGRGRVASYVGLLLRAAEVQWHEYPSIGAAWHLRSPIAAGGSD